MYIEKAMNSITIADSYLSNRSKVDLSRSKSQSRRNIKPVKKMVINNMKFKSSTRDKGGKNAKVDKAMTMQNKHYFGRFKLV